ncbi:aminotransferase [Xanthobacter agilis]|uniref:Aspartate/methionine/tyrosine aminotransferase n=1 Tax=Xanthobacter agilis TaxID=47492 RepID=A0ABU0LBT1_XANAG|nr:aminotransferase [Xanthobacter agilis]MDQ0504593.1 aspartate/methionine/tyrosine aminotransferase [Xanthobacter agilis]
MTASAPLRPLNAIYSALPTTIFEVMSQLARTHDAVNLGQGFPDDPGPLDVRQKAADAVLNGWNQYPSMMGLPELRQAAAAHFRHWQGLDLDPDTEVMVTSGATEALAAALFGLIEPGDEVVLFQPLYDAYLPLVQRAGGIARLVRLEPPHWTITGDKLKAAFSDRTKLVLLNNPQNPTGVVHSRAELQLLADFCLRFGAYAVCDEVWEHIVFDGLRFEPLMAFDGMRERTVKISSAGKIFGMTGWKVGMVFAAPPLMKVLSKAHQFLTFTTPPNLQAAVAYGLGKDDGYFTAMRAGLQRSRDRLTDGLAGLGFRVLPSAGTYFLTVDLSAHSNAPDDEAFCLDLAKTHKVAAIPVSAFYAQDAVRNVVRFCFAKNDATIDKALERLSHLRLVA